MNTVIPKARRDAVYNLTVRLVVWECPSCGIVYGIPESFADDLRASGGSYYCPNGHQLSWTETDADRERKKRVRAERDAQWQRQLVHIERERAETAERSRAAIKGHLTRARNRIANGVCPVPGCKRSGFDQVRQHIASVHPEWAEQHPDALGESV